MSKKHGQALDDKQRLKVLARTQLLDSPIESSFDKLTAFASKLTNAPVSLISLIEPHRQFFKSQIGLNEPVASKREIPIELSFCKHVVLSGEALIIENVYEEPLVADNQGIVELDVKSYLGIPLITADGWNLGAFCVIDSQARTWTNDDIETMTTLAESVTREIQLRLDATDRQELIVELQNRNQDLDAFSHSVSHNLKNSISAIIGWTDVSTRYAEKISFDELLETMQKIRELGMNTNDTINALLLLAGVDNTVSVEMKHLPMLNILEDALTRLELDIVATRAEILLPEKLPNCVGHRDWVEEVWMNYISNALKYGGKPPKVEFGADILPDNQIRYWIKDNGNGITEQDMANLFKRFSRLDHDSGIEGHGLGLSIIKRIVDKLGGEVAARSTVGEGSVFCFTLPAK